MVGKLQIIFGVYAVIIDLGIMCHFLVFIEHLRCVAACPIVNPVVAVNAASAPVIVAVIIVATATTATRLTIIHQILGILIPLICGLPHQRRLTTGNCATDKRIRNSPYKTNICRKPASLSSREQARDLREKPEIIWA